MISQLRDGYIVVGSMLTFQLVTAWGCVELFSPLYIPEIFEDISISHLGCMGLWVPLSIFSKVAFASKAFWGFPKPPFSSCQDSAS